MLACSQSIPRPARELDEIVVLKVGSPGKHLEDLLQHIKKFDKLEN